MDNQALKRQLAARMRAQTQAEAEPQQQGYKRFSASELYCPVCKRSMPVREKHLLVLPGGDLFDYVCAQCGTSLGTKEG